MVKTPSAGRVVQSYLARRPAKAGVLTVQAGQEVTGGWVFDKAAKVITGELGREKVEIFARPDRVIEDFANTSSKPEDILRFTQHYGVLHRRDPEWFEVEPGEEIMGDRFCVHCDQWLESQERMRTEWARRGKTDQDSAQNLADQIPKMPSGRDRITAIVRPGKRGFQLELQPDDLLGALWVAFIGCSDRTRKCQNPTCSGPYFLASRRDQKFCSEACSRLVANRRWWSKKGTLWRKEQKSKSD